MEHQASQTLGSVLMVSGWIVAIIVVVIWRVAASRQKPKSFQIGATPPRRASAAGSMVSSTSTESMPAPPVAEPTYTPPPEPEPADEPQLSPEELVNKHWPTEGVSLADKASVALRAIKRETEVEWDDNDQLQYDEPAATEFIEPLQRRGCTTSDLLVAYYNETGVRMGSILLYVLTDVDITADDLITAFRGADIELDSDELSNLLDADDVTLELLLRLARGLNLSCAQVIDLYEQGDVQKPEIEELVSAARAVGYTDAEIIKGIDAYHDNLAHTVNDAFEQGISFDILITYLREAGVDPEELSNELNEDDAVSFDHKIDVLHALLHPPAAPSTEAESSTPASEPAPSD